MTIVPGKMVNGHVEIEAGDLPEGAEVTVYFNYSPGGVYELTADEEAELDESIAEIERGEYVDGDEFLAERRRRRDSDAVQAAAHETSTPRDRPCIRMVDEKPRPSAARVR